MSRAFNFSAGPAMLPEPVLQQIQSELFDWRNHRVSVMEIGHRTEPFTEFILQIEANLRELLHISDDYAVLFLPGGASVQFAMVPSNLMAFGKYGAYIETGNWSTRAIAEAKKYGQVRVIATNQPEGNFIPDPKGWQDFSDASYLHYTTNETITGVEFPYIPDSGQVPLVADMTSSILMQPLDVERFGLIYAGTQKNVGISGLSLVIVRKDLMGKALPQTPSVFDLAQQAQFHSCYNTPPTFAIYVTGLVLEWLKKEGGLVRMAEINQRKANKLYSYIDNSQGFYRNSIQKEFRSLANVSFNLNTPELENEFLTQAGAAGFLYLKGHRVSGGIRASIYNAMPETAVDQLVTFMQDFQTRYFS